MQAMEIVPAGRRPAWVDATYGESAAGPFSVLYRDTGKREQERWAQFWADALEQWLASGRRRSEHTRRSYRSSVEQFEDYLEMHQGITRLWHVTGRHVLAWVEHMQNKGASKRTVAARMAACSSYYRFVIRTTSLWAGREVSLFVDAYGAPRSNPFDDSSVERPRVSPFSGAKPVSVDAFQWILKHLEERAGPLAAIETLRNRALLLAFGFLGWRNDEVITMQWGRIGEGRQPNTYTYQWTGKARDGEIENRALPAVVYNAIVEYLRADGRYRPGRAGHIDGDDYIWRPVRTEGCANFPNAAGNLDGNRHIGPSSSNSILRGLLRRYYRHVAAQRGIYGKAAREWAKERASQYTIHGLRHLFAHELYEGSGNNIKLVSERLGHKSLATTQVYLKSLEEPTDDFSDLLAARYGYGPNAQQSGR